MDEFAAYNREGGMNVVKIDGVWWAQVRPFFYRPLFPFAAVNPGRGAYPRGAMAGGVLHAVPSRALANTQINLLVYDNLREYSLETLGEKQRWQTKKGIRNFTARRIVDAREFSEDAYEVYLSFYNRTRHRYKSERLQRSKFRSWAKVLFDNPGTLVIGAYHQGKLAAVDVSFLVEDIIYEDIFFSDTESQRLKVTDFMLHVLRDLAATTEARYIFRGLPTGKASLDQSKVNRGCKLLQLPGYCRINPLALFAARLFMPDSYRKLIELTGRQPAGPVPPAVVPPLPAGREEEGLSP